MLVRQRDDFLQRRPVEIGRDFHEHRPARHVAPLDRAEQVIESRAILELAQAGRVRRADIERKVIAKNFQPLERQQVVARRLLDWSHFRFADVDPHRNPRPAPGSAKLLEPRRDHVAALVVKTEPVDQPADFRHAKNPRLRIPRLRARGDRPHFREPKPERLPRRERHRILVEARREPDRIGKRDAEDRAREPRIARRFQRRERRPKRREPPHREMMHRLGIHAEKQRAEELGVGRERHGAELGAMWDGLPACQSPAGIPACRMGRLSRGNRQGCPSDSDRLEARPTLRRTRGRAIYRCRKC